MARKKNNPLANKAWKPLPTGSVGFDQTSGALAAVDRIPEADARGMQRIVEGGIITTLA